MLVLSRYRDESIVIGDDIVVTIVDVRGDRVRLGIQAPSHVSVHRREIYEAIARSKESDSDTSPAKSQEQKKGKTLPTESLEPSAGTESFGVIS